MYTNRLRKSMFLGLFLLYITLMLNAKIQTRQTMAERPTKRVLGHIRPISPRDVILIFAPHPDDETVATAGFIQEALQKGARVKLVFITCGDAFRYAAQLRLRRVLITPKDMLTLGRLRQSESIAAAAALGLPESAVTFLGFPDQGLARLWQESFQDTPYTSPYTRANSSPYENTLKMVAAYTGQELLDQIETLIARESPTIILFPSQYDGHSDHWACAAFVTYALNHLRVNNDLLNTPELYTYLVHYPNWPRPWGVSLTVGLLPPSSISENEWFRLDLSWQSRINKLKAVSKYRSQLPVLGGFLRSFVRANELYVSPPSITNLEYDRDGESKLIVSDPIGDSIVDRLDRSADITGLYAALDEDSLYLQLYVRGIVSPKTSYRLEVVALTNDTIGKQRLVICYPVTDYARGVVADGKTNYMEVSIERSALSDVSEILISAETFYGRRKADRLPHVQVRLDWPDR